MSKDELFNLIKTKPNGNIEEKSFSKKFENFYKIINGLSFPLNFKWTQKLYHYFNDDIELKLGICPVCHKRCTFRSINLGYLHHCSKECKYNDTNVTEKMKQTNLNKYGVAFQGNRDDIVKKMKQTCLDKYGVEWSSQSCNFREKVKNTCIRKFGKTSFMKSNEFKKKTEQTCLKKYGNKVYMKSDDFQLHKRCTKNNGIKGNVSKIEKHVSEWLNKSNINFIYQYYSDLYPYRCDFYLTDFDLYIEIQGHWTHGKHQFDENNQNDIDILEMWKLKNDNYYNKAVYIWSVSDVKKRQTAKENKLNYLEIFSYNIEEVINIIKNEIHKYII